MGRFLHGLGGFCARRPLVAIGLWVVVALGVAGAVRLVGAETSNDLELPGTGSQQVQDLLAERFPPQQNGINPIVFHVGTGTLTDSAEAQAVKESVQALRRAPHVHSVTNPVGSNGQAAGLLSADGRTAFAPVLLDIGSGELDEESAQVVLDATAPARDAGIDVAAAGAIGSNLSKQSTESSELVGILAAMLILTLVLGSLVAMGLPIIAAVAGLAVALGVVGLLGHVVAMPDTGATLATMIGLGVGIDYALFLISRHQAELDKGTPVAESVARATGTSGSAIVFAGGTVVVALLSLRVAGIPLLSTLGLASATAVVTAVLAAVTLLPALLGLLGHRIMWLRVPSWGRRRGPAAGDRTGWRRWAAFVARHPGAVVLASTALLVPLVVPAFSLRFGQEDIGATDRSTTERQAYDLITAGFGVGYNGPLQVASRFDPVVTPSEEYTDKYDRATGLKDDLERKQKQLPKEQQRLEATQRSLERQQAQLEDEGAQLSAQGDALRAEQGELLAAQAALEAQGAALQRQGEALARQAAHLRAQKAALVRQQRALEARAAPLEAERDRLRAQAAAVLADLRPLLRELGRLLLRQRLLERRIAGLDDDPARQARLQARLATVEQREAATRTAIAPLRRQAQVLAGEARQLAARAAPLLRQAAALRARAAALQRQADELRREQAALQGRAAALQRQAAELERRGDALRVRSARLQDEADALQQRSADLQRQATELQQQAAQLTSEQQQAQQEKQEAEKLQKELTTMLTAAGGDPRNTDPRVVRLQETLAGTDGVATLTLPQTNGEGDVVLLSAVPSTGPATVATTELLTTVRDEVVPDVEEPGGIRSYVGGYTASYVDLASLISQRLLLVVGVVIMLGFLLLMVAFRSLLVPLQAAVTNVLSAAAAFGILTATFQWGWGASLVGVDTAASGVPIASYVPLMMFAVLFGLSMDYEVFLVSHVQQHHLAGEPARTAVVSGLSSSARITTAACLIMTTVFASFVLNGDPTIKQFGVGLASAVLLAGILVVTLAPAAIMVMGEAAWWLPRWLDRVLPHMDIEGEATPAEPEAPAAAPVLLPAQRADPESGTTEAADTPRPGTPAR